MKRERILDLLGLLAFYLNLSNLSCYSTTDAEVVAYLLFLSLIALNAKWLQLFDKEKAADRTRTVILFLFAFFIPALIHWQFPFATDLLQWMAILMIISLKNDYRVRILNVAVFWFSVVLLCSIVEYVIGYTTNQVYILATSSSQDDIEIVQSVFNIYRYGDLQYRFTALASEPGHLGAICGFILAFLPVNRRNLFPLVVCLIGGMLSLSLGFYIYLTFILLYKTLAKEIRFRYMLLIVFVLSCMVVLFYQEIQHSIMLRMTESERLDNRSSDQVNQFVYNIFSSQDALYGVGNRTAYVLDRNSGQGNAGLKWKLYQYGIIGCGCYLLAMYLLYKRQRNRNVPFLFGIIFYLLYFYSVGAWGVPLFVLLLFTTQTDLSKKKILLKREIHTYNVINSINIGAKADSARL